MPTVKLMPQGIEVMLSKGSSLTDLEFELYGQESIPFGCKVGACGACVIEVIDGVACLGNKTEEEASFLDMLGYSGDSFRLACQCRVSGIATIRAAARNS
jgi:ferredoxin